MDVLDRELYTDANREREEKHHPSPSLPLQGRKRQEFRTRERRDAWLSLASTGGLFIALALIGMVALRWILHNFR